MLAYPASFGENVFTLAVAKQYLNTDAYEKLVRASTQHGHRLSRQDVLPIANALKLWATNKGATHYTHWFQPLTGHTAVKYDAFLSRDKHGGYISDFNVSSLIQIEPDASSFPHGGLRSTFESRGYTAWDPSSPPFILERAGGSILCIPAIFVSYTGLALDYKGPLLKSISVLKDQALALAKTLDDTISSVVVNLGWEQEYFLLERQCSAERLDLTLTGATLLGCPPIRGQQLNDRYFGSIPDRVHQFMCDFETQAYKLGIPIKTKHNEVAPCQFECVPIYEEMNLSVDHNMLLMDVMREVSRRHGFKILFHEKPFAGLNGSGKHCNWSLSTDTGINLLSAGAAPQNNLLFLSFLVCVIRAVYEHNGLLCASVYSFGNEQRFGGHEAPPAVVSIFIGSDLTKTLQIIEQNACDEQPMQGVVAKLGSLVHMPDVLTHSTDRNRTSPFAFTGDKFEFRSPGSSANCAGPLTVLNTIVADQIARFRASVTERQGQVGSRKEAFLHVIAEYIRHSKGVLFEGDGYSEAWLADAQKRHLFAPAHAVDAFAAWKHPETIAVFSRMNVFSSEELYSRYDVFLRNYVERAEIACKTLLRMCTGDVRASVLHYQNELLEILEKMHKLGFEQAHNQTTHKTLHKISLLAEELADQTQIFEQEIQEAQQNCSLSDYAQRLATDLRVRQQKIRHITDELEKIIPGQYWHFPRYDALLLLP